MDSNNQIVRARTRDKPEGGIALTEKEVLEIHHKLIMEWTPRSEIWPFTYGVGILGGAAAITGALMNHNLRSGLRLASHARLMTYLPNVIIPSMFSMMVHSTFVTNMMLLGLDDCPSCLAIRSCALQSSVGWIQPVFLSFTTCVTIARIKRTTVIPAMTDLMGTGKFIAGLLRPFKMTSLGLLALNFGAAMYVTQAEAKMIGPINKALSEGKYTFRSMAKV